MRIYILGPPLLATTKKEERIAFIVNNESVLKPLTTIILLQRFSNISLFALYGTAQLFILFELRVKNQSGKMLKYILVLILCNEIFHVESATFSIDRISETHHNLLFMCIFRVVFTW